MSLSMRYIHSLYEFDKISTVLYDALDDKLMAILKEDFGYDAKIKSFGGTIFDSQFLVLYL